MAPPLEPDLKAGFTGLIVALLFLLATMYGIVLLTNRQFAGHAAAPAATQPH